MREVAKQAKILQEEQNSQRSSRNNNQNSFSESFDCDSERPIKRGLKKRQQGIKRPKDMKATNGNQKSTGNKKKNKDLPICLNLDCDEHHYIRQCKLTPQSEKKRLVKEFREKTKTEWSRKSEKAAVKEKVNRVGTDQIDSHSSLLSAFFCEGAVKTMVLADQGADLNLIPSRIFACLQKADPSLKTTTLNPPHIYNGITTTEGQPAHIKCTQALKMDVQLRIRHGLKLLPRSLE